MKSHSCLHGTRVILHHYDSASLHAILRVGARVWHLAMYENVKKNVCVYARARVCVYAYVWLCLLSESFIIAEMRVPNNAIMPAVLMGCCTRRLAVNTSQTVTHYKGITSPPKDYGEWGQVVGRMGAH